MTAGEQIEELKKALNKILDMAVSPKEDAEALNLIIDIAETALSRFSKSEVGIE